MKKHFLIGIAALAIACSASEARAATIVLDFGNAAIYGGANAATPFSTTDQGVGVHLTSAGGTLRQTSEGLGVNGAGFFEDSGEVGFGEVLSISFTSPQYVDSVSLEQLFTNDPFWSLNEKGQYSINGGAFVPFSAVSSLGLLTLSIETAGVNSLLFRVPGSFGSLADDYSVRSMELTTVPEPASLILVGSGLAGAFMRRRKQRQGVVNE